MPTSYTSLLGLALPATGELSGSWGDTVNDYLTQYVDAAVAGTQTISGSQTAVTLSKTTGGSLSQAGSGATGSSQYQIINCTGNPAGMLTVTAPAASKVYLVLNNTSTSQPVKVVGAGPTTGVTVAAGTSALVAWNGSDFEAVGSTATGDVVGPASSTNNNVVLFDGVTGKLIKDGGKGLPSGAVVGTTDSQTLTNKTIEAGTFTNGYTEETFTANTGTAYTIDLANGTVQILTLTGNCTLTFPAVGAGKSFLLFIKQDGTGSRTLSYAASPPVRWPSSTAPTITATANRMDKFVFTSDGTNWYGSNGGQDYTV